MYGEQGQIMRVLREVTGKAGISFDLGEMGLGKGSLVLPSPGAALSMLGRSNEVEGTMYGMLRNYPELLTAMHTLQQNPGDQQLRTTVMRRIDLYRKQLSEATSGPGMRRRLEAYESPGFGGQIQASPALAPGEMWIPQKRLTGMLSEVWGSEEFGGTDIRKRWKTPAEAAEAMLRGREPMISDPNIIRWPINEAWQTNVSLRALTFKQAQERFGGISWEQAQGMGTLVAPQVAQVMSGDWDVDPFGVKASLAESRGVLRDMNAFIQERAVTGVGQELQSTLADIAAAPTSAADAFAKTVAGIKSYSIGDVSRGTLEFEEGKGMMGTTYSTFMRSLPTMMESGAAGITPDQIAEMSRLSERMISEFGSPLYMYAQDAAQMPGAATRLLESLSYNAQTRGIYQRSIGEPGRLSSFIASSVREFGRLGASLGASGETMAAMFASPFKEGFSDIASLFGQGDINAGPIVSKLIALSKDRGTENVTRDIVDNSPWLRMMVGFGYQKAVTKDPNFLDTLDDWERLRYREGQALRTRNSLLSQSIGRRFENISVFTKNQQELVNLGLMTEQQAKDNADMVYRMGVTPGGIEGRTRGDVPQTDQQAMAFLQTVPGVGPILSSRIGKMFGSNLPTILANRPSRLSEVQGVGPRLVGAIRDAWEEATKGSMTSGFFLDRGKVEEGVRPLLEEIEPTTIGKLSGVESLVDQIAPASRGVLATPDEYVRGLLFGDVRSENEGAAFRDLVEESHEIRMGRIAGETSTRFRDVVTHLERTHNVKALEAYYELLEKYGLGVNPENNIKYHDYSSWLEEHQQTELDPTGYINSLLEKGKFGGVDVKIRDRISGASGRRIHAIARNGEIEIDPPFAMQAYLSGAYDRPQVEGVLPIGKWVKSVQESLDVSIVHEWWHIKGERQDTVASNENMANVVGLLAIGTDPAELADVYGQDVVEKAADIATRAAEALGTRKMPFSTSYRKMGAAWLSGQPKGTLEQMQESIKNSFAQGSFSVFPREGAEEEHWAAYRLVAEDLGYSLGEHGDITESGTYSGSVTKLVPQPEGPSFWAGESGEEVRRTRREPDLAAARRSIGVEMRDLERDFGTLINKGLVRTRFGIESVVPKGVDIERTLIEAHMDPDLAFRDEEYLKDIGDTLKSVKAGNQPTKADMARVGQAGNILRAAKRLDPGQFQNVREKFKDDAAVLIREAKDLGVDTTGFEKQIQMLSGKEPDTIATAASVNTLLAGELGIEPGDFSNLSKRLVNFKARDREAGGATPLSNAELEEELKGVTQRLITTRKNVADAMSGSSKMERDAVEQMVSRTAQREADALTAQAYSGGGMGGAADFMGSSAYGGFLDEMGGGEGGGGGGFIRGLRNIKSLLTPFSPEGALIKAGFRIFAGDVRGNVQAYAQAGMADIDIAARAGDTTGIFGGTAGTAIVNIQQRQMNTLAAGRAAQQTWGWAMAPWGSGLAEARGVFGLPVAAGAGLGIAAARGVFGGMSAAATGGAATGAIAAAGPIGLVAGTAATILGGTLYANAISKDTPENRYQSLEDEQQAASGYFLDKLWYGSIKPGMRENAAIRRDPSLFTGTTVTGGWRIPAEGGGNFPISSSMARGAEREYSADFSSLTMQERISAVSHGVTQFMRDPELAGYGPDAIRQGIGQEMAFSGVASVEDIDSGDLGRLLAGGGEYGAYSQTAAALQMGPSGAWELLQWQQGLGQRGMGAAYAVQQYAPLTKFGFSASNIMKLAERGPLTGQAATDFGRVMSGDTRFIDKQIRSTAPSSFSFQTGLDLRGQRGSLTSDPLGLPLGYTSGFSDIFASMGQAELDLIGGPIGDMLSGTFALGGTMDNAIAAGAIKATYPDIGFIQDWSGESILGLEQGYKQERRSQAAQSRGIQWGALAHRYGSGPWNTVEDLGGTYQQQRQQRQLSTALGYATQEGGIYTNMAGEDISFTGSFAFQERSINAQYGSAMAGIGLGRDMLSTNRDWQVKTRGWERSDMYTGIERGRIQMGYQRDDMQQGLERGSTQYGWQQQDMQRSWSSFGLQMEGVELQRGYQQEDLARSRATSELQFGWQMEDFDESIRFASGRQRKQLVTQRERAVTMQNISDEGIDIQESRTEELTELEDERFTLQKEGMEAQQDRLEEQEEWRTKDYDTQMERFEEQSTWREEDWAKQTERFDEKVEYEDEVYGLQKRNYDQQEASLNANHALQMEQLKESIRAYGEQKTIAEDTETIQDSIDLKQAQTQAAQLAVAAAVADSENAMEDAIDMYNLMKTINDANGFTKAENMFRGLKAWLDAGGF